MRRTIAGVSVTPLAAAHGASPQPPPRSRDQRRREQLAPGRGVCGRGRRRDGHHRLLTTYYLPTDGAEWTAYGKPSTAVAPIAAGFPLVLPPAE